MHPPQTGHGQRYLSHFLLRILNNSKIRECIPQTGHGQRYLCPFSWNFNQFQYSVYAFHRQDIDRGDSVYLF